MENIHIVIDTSSSMSVLSKRSILHNICLFIKGVSNSIEYREINFIFYTWDENSIKEYSFEDELDIKLSCSIDIKDLINFIKFNSDDTLKIILLTDGYIRTLSYTISYGLLKNTIINIINVGIDSDTFVLAKKLGALSFNAENISQALSYICFHV